jgi:hypothetical protein
MGMIARRIRKAGTAKDHGGECPQLCTALFNLLYLSDLQTLILSIATLHATWVYAAMSLHAHMTLGHSIDPALSARAC